MEDDGDGSVRKNEGGESERSELTPSRPFPSGVLAVQTTFFKLSNGDLKRGDVVKKKNATLSLLTTPC